MDSPAADEGIFGPRHRALTIAVMGTIAIIAYNNLGASAALPDIGSDLGDVAWLPWIISIELLTSGVAVLASGPLIDSLGPRRVFRWAVVWFAITSVACGVAPTMVVLVGARALQGLAAGTLLTAAMAAIGLSYAAAARARVFALNSTVWGVTSVAGPSVAAVMVAVFSWRGVLLFNVPVAVIAAALAWNALPGPAEDADHSAPADIRGIALVSVIAAAGLAVAEGSLTALILGSIVVVIGIAAYRSHARHTDQPVVKPAHLFADRYRSVHTTSLLAIGGALGFHAFVPVYLKAARGASTTAAAFSVVYLSAGWTTGAIVASRLQERIGRERTVLVGACALLPGIGGTALLVVLEAPVPLLAVGLFVAGLGTGSMSTTGINVLQERSPLTEMGRLNAAHQFARTMAITYSVGIAGAIILTTVDRRTGDVEAVRDLLGGDVDTVEASVADALATGFQFAMLMATVAAALTIPAALHLVRTRDQAVTSAA